MADSSEADGAALQRDSRLTISIEGEQLELLSVAASEGFSQPFLVTIELLSTLGEFDLLPHLGKPAMVEGLRDGVHMRYFHGIITDGCMVGDSVTGSHTWAGQVYHYRLTLRPRAFFHALGRNFRIFQEKSVIDIVKKVLADCGIAIDVKLTSESLANRMLKYCVQYGESDFDFVCRLLEEHGLYYYYRHEESDHILVICDGASSHGVSSASPLAFDPYGGSKANAGSAHRGDEGEYVTEWQALLSTGAESVATMRDWDFEQPGAPRLADTASKADHADDKIEVYTWPGRYYVEGDGKKLSSYQLEARRAQRVRYDGVAATPALQIGQKFALKDHPVGRFNADYLIITTHTTLAAETYRSGSGSSDTAVHFTAIPVDTQFRAPQVTPRPVACGPETAIVVGPAGEEIYVDKYGRIKVQFHWDRDGQNNEESSCWLRVSQTGGLGNIIIPRIGHEVLVDFINGNPDRPIAVGRVFNAAHMPTYALPDNKTRAVWRTKTYKRDSGDPSYGVKPLDSGAPGANEIRFEDKTGGEEMYVHAEKDLNTRVRNNETHKVGGNEDIFVGGNRTEEVDGDEKITIKGNRTEEVDGNEKITIKGNRTEAVQGDEKVDVKGNRTVSITGNDKLSVTGDLKVEVTGQISMSSMQKITLTCGSNSIVIDQCGVTIDAIMLKATGSAMAEIGSPMTTIKGDGMLTAKGGIVMIN